MTRPRTDGCGRPTRRARILFAGLVCAVTLVGPAWTSAAVADDDPDGTISHLRDDRIKEASGLALSARFPDLAYTLNDGTDSKIYAIKVSTGQTVGTTDLRDLDLKDTESLYVDPKGTMWVGDLGDNDGSRHDGSIVTFPEPGPGKHGLPQVQRTPVSYDGGPVNVEAMLVNPVTNQVFLASKNKEGHGTLYQLADFSPGVPAHATDMNVQVPKAVSDGTFTTDGKWALLRTGSDVWIYSPARWAPVRRLEAKGFYQSESMAVESSNRSILLGSEGKDSPIARIELPADLAAHQEPINVDEGSQNKTGVDIPGVDVPGLGSDDPSAFGIPVGLIVAAGVGITGLAAATGLRRARSRR